MADFLRPLLLVFALPLLLPPLSLPLSGTACADRANASSIGFSAIGSGLASAEGLLFDGPCTVPIAGVAGRLLSCTVSSIDPVPLTPRAGVRIPECGVVSSLSISVVIAELSVSDIDDGVGRSTKMLGVRASWSDLRGENTNGLVEVANGGGDFSLGDAGQCGVFSPGPDLLAF